ncbi:hypothetical protein AB0D27_35565 [Streptomyces sp. NPDC048415]|uniref:hypothetical protein n=1 Tax=Streptomyces sp. NPDC048415 TaxID=3154822 RepID=UPI00344135CF
MEGVVFRLQVAVPGRLLVPGEAACVGLGEDIELDQALQLGAGAFDVLRQQFVVEGFTGSVVARSA